MTRSAPAIGRALVAVGEAASPVVTAELERDPEIVVWWPTGIERVSALMRLERGPRAA